jgi:putative transposase
VHVDNAKEFHSLALERGCRQHGIQLDYRPVRTPHYGGHIERLMGTLMGRVHALPGTTFSNIREKGDSNPEAAAALTLRELEMAFALDVLGPYHMEVHSALGIPPLAAWSERLTRRPRPPLVPSEGPQWLQDFLPFKEGTAAKVGVTRRSPLVGIRRSLDKTSVRSRNRACHCRRRSEPEAADPNRVVTTASAEICSSAGSP